MAQLPLAWAAPRRRLRQAPARTRAKAGAALAIQERRQAPNGRPGAALRPLATSMTISAALVAPGVPLTPSLR